jgi:hypothetical protein
MQMTIHKLIDFLKDVSPGTIPTNLNGELFQLVVATLHEFSGSAETRMEPWKISRDAGPEDVTWSPPLLSFTIERHGGTVLGSTRAEKQRWTLNLESRTADYSQIGFRQLYPKAPKLDVRGLADEVCKAVREGPSSTSRHISGGVIVWENDDELTVFHGKIIGGRYQRTVSDRRKRFRADLETKMKMIGWEFTSVGRGLKFKKIK